MIPPHSLLPPINPRSPPSAPHILTINRADVHCVLYLQSCVWDRCLQFTVVALNFNAHSLYSAQIYFHEISPLSKNDPPKRIKILKEKMSRPITDTPLSDLSLLFSLCAHRAVVGGGAGRAVGGGGGGPWLPPPPPTRFLPQNIKTCTNKS